MSQQVRVERELVFVGDANQEANVKGNFAPKRKCASYDYTELALDDTNKYTPYLDTTSSIALADGGITLTTAATDTKTCSQSQGGIWWYPARNPEVEMIFRIDVITTVAIYAGFTDAVSEASSYLPFSLTTATLADKCTNGVGFLYDTNQTLSYFNVVNTNANTEAFTQLSSSHVPVADTDITIRVAIDSSGNAKYYWNGTECGYKALATATTIPLVPYFGIRNNSDSAHVATLKRVRLWCDV